MARELRIILKSWKHPKNNRGKYKPIFKEDMPKVKEGNTIEYVIYENTTEGTPISPAFDTKEKLFKWLVKNKINAYSLDLGTESFWYGVIYDEAPIVLISLDRGEIKAEVS